MDVKDKIKKLLSLATSPNENEARAALLKAKKLMMEHKLSEEDISDKDLSLKHVMMKDIKWTTDSGDIWMVDLCRVIADNYLCTTAWATRKGARTHTLEVTGIGDDVEVCTKAIEFAVGVVNNSIRNLQRKYSHSESRSIKDSYAKGYIMGLEMAFDEQREEHQEWGLVAVQPKEVQDYKNSLGSKSVRAKTSDRFNALAHLEGIKDGSKFNARAVIE